MSGISDQAAAVARARSKVGLEPLGVSMEGPAGDARDGYVSALVGSLVRLEARQAALAEAERVAQVLQEQANLAVRKAELAKQEMHTQQGWVYQLKAEIWKLEYEASARDIIDSILPGVDTTQPPS